MAQLHPISDPMAAERELDVVFVHGLGEDWQGTWRRSREQLNAWPEWLAEQFGSRIGVWSLSYPASKTRWARLFHGLRGMLRGRHDPEAGAAMTLARRTVNVLHRLQLSGIGERPVLFITHSLGGLLVKSVLREAATTPGRAEMQRLAEQCRGVMFLATPHQGSLLANFAKAIRVYLPSVSTRALRSNSEQLLELQRWYRGYAASQRIHTRSYYENQPTSVVTVVSAWSSDPGVSGPTARDPIPLDRNHLEISQPLDRNDEVVLGAAELIREVLQDAPIASSDATQAAATEAVVLVRSFQAAWQRDPADAAVAVDLSDLFNGRQPIHAGVWAVDIPQRIAAVMPAIARLPLPCVLALEAHLVYCPATNCYNTRHNRAVRFNACLKTDAALEAFRGRASSAAEYRQFTLNATLSRAASTDRACLWRR